MPKQKSRDNVRRRARAKKRVGTRALHAASVAAAAPKK